MEDQYKKKYLKYKSKYLKLKNLFGGCSSVPPASSSYNIFNFLRNIFVKNTIYSLNGSTLGTVDNHGFHADTRVSETLNCSIKQIIEYSLIDRIQQALVGMQPNNIILIDGANLMRNKWFLRLVLMVMSKMYTKDILTSISKYIENNAEESIFSTEISWFYSAVMKIFGDLMGERNLILVFNQKNQFDTPVPNQLNTNKIRFEAHKNLVYWVPISCEVEISGKKEPCVTSNSLLPYERKNEADDFALILMYIFLKTSFNSKVTYVLSGDNYTWYRGTPIERVVIDVFSKKEENKKILYMKYDLRNKYNYLGSPVNLITYNIVENNSPFKYSNFGNIDKFYNYFADYSNRYSK